MITINTKDPLDDVLGVTPRWTLLSRVMNADNTERNTSAVLLVMDMETEDVLLLFHPFARSSSSCQRKDH